MQAAQLFVPEFGGAGEIPVHLFSGVFFTHGPSGFDYNGVAFGAVGADEFVAQAVKAVGGEMGGEELVAVLFVVQVVLDDAVLIAAARSVEAHLEIPVIHVDLAEAEFQIGEYCQVAGLSRVVAQLYIPDLHGIVHGHEQLLLGVDAGVVAVVFDIAQAVAAGVVLPGLAHGLPGDRPVVAAVLIPQVNVVARAVHGDAVGAEAGDPVVFRGLVQQIASRGVVEYAVHILQADVVGPGNRHIHPVDYIFPIGIVKISVPHSSILPA